MVNYGRWIDKLGGIIVNNRASQWARRIDRAALRLHYAYENVNYDCRFNGELRVLRCIAPYVGRGVVFDVGANKGEWSKLALDALPDAQVHAFEIVPSTYEILYDCFRGTPNITVNNLGLADITGIIDVYFSEIANELSSCVEGFVESYHGIIPRREKVPVTTGDEYCEKQGIETIGMLKIDVEGYEKNVLQGFQSMLNGGRIQVIQFEYGYANVATRFLLKDFYELFEASSMLVGKVYPEGVEFRPYSYWHEDFLGPNYLAVHKSCSQIIEAMKC